MVNKRMNVRFFTMAITAEKDKEVSKVGRC